MLLLSLAALGLSALTASEPDYRDHVIQGWTFRVESRLVEGQPLLWQMVRDDAERQSRGIARVVPDAPLKELRKVIVWVHASSPETICMAFHPGAQWLRDHKMNPEMAGHVEIGSGANFVSWTYEQPWMLMHEFAHAYHFRVLEGGFSNADVADAFKASMAAKRYDSVLQWNGKRVKGYAANNPMEYFAESTEAYFGTNDFYPFVRAELREADPDAHALMVKIWGEPQKRTGKS